MTHSTCTSVPRQYFVHCPPALRNVRRGDHALQCPAWLPLEVGHLKIPLPISSAFPRCVCFLPLLHHYAGCIPHAAVSFVRDAVSYFPRSKETNPNV